MIYSKSHIRLSEDENCNGALEDPEKFLGPNYETVLNFWSWNDTLSLEQMEESERRFESLNLFYHVTKEIEAAARSVIGIDYENAAWYSLDFCAQAWATEELIAMHDILSQGKELIFVPLFANL